MTTSYQKTVTHLQCGKSWPNGTRNSHCTVCHQTFGNHDLADRHRKDVGAERICIDPAELRYQGYQPVLRAGVWKSGKPSGRFVKQG
ncbi:FDXHR family putative zinc-binding protein [Arthrobacter tecti]